MTHAAAKLPCNATSSKAKTRRRFKLAVEKVSSAPAAATLDELCRLYPGLKLLDAAGFSFTSYELWLDLMKSR